MDIAEKLQTIAENQQKVYDAGYEKGKSEGGGGGSADPATEAVMSLLRLSRKTNVGEQWQGGVFTSEAFSNENDYQGALAILPEQVTHTGDINITDCVKFLSLPITPPIAEWFGWWSPDGGMNTVGIIYVPDESINAYKSATNWAEFADRMKPMSDLIPRNGEIKWYYGQADYGMNTTMTAREGMTWGEWVDSEYNTNKNMFVSDGYYILVSWAAPMRGPGGKYVTLEDVIYPCEFYQ